MKFRLNRACNKLLKLNYTNTIRLTDYR